MIILSGRQMHEWDEFTIRNKPISSLDLMETAANRCSAWLQQHGLQVQPVHIFCGKGNNGGDGLAIARLLAVKGVKVSVYILELGQTGTTDFQANLVRLHQTAAAISYIQHDEHLPAIPEKHIIIDALFGTGLNRSLTGMAASLVQYINKSKNTIISIDLPSGMLADDSSKSFPVVAATHTLSFQCLKLAFLVAENEAFVGSLHILDIGLLTAFLSELAYEAVFLDEDIIRSLYRPRPVFSHKGNFGHAALLAGSFGFMGAATLAANACLRSGVGKLTCHIPQCGYSIMQLAAPEAMAKVEKGEQFIESAEQVDKYDALGIGPGLGQTESHKNLLEQVFKSYQKPVVMDADALNILAKSPELFKLIPHFSILSPHPAEFDRLFGKQDNDFSRIRLARQKAREHQLVIILKGHRTLIAMPGGNCFFNSTGNPGMATGGSGDVLTGMLTGLLAQGYPPDQAALLGVYLHGLAGDLAATKLSEESMVAGDITAYLGKAFLQIRQRH